MSITAIRGKIGQTKVKRYWPGKAPEWAKEADQEEDHDVRMHKVNDNLGFVRKDDDPRLRRLAQATRIENREEVKADHQRIRQAEIMWAEEELRNLETIDEEEDEDALEERRRRIREKNLNRVQEEEEEEEEEELQDDEEEEEEEESEYASDSEEDTFGFTMIKPVYVTKDERDTITERERIEAEEEALEELAKRKLEMRKIETKQIVVEEVRKYEENMLLEEEEANIGDVETDDEINEAEEYKVWMTREFARIKRERDDPKEDMLREKEEIEKLRNNPKEASSAQPKKKRKFVRKYYHKGAFFQTDDGIFQRDFSAPTEQDKLDNSFGRSGRTKWTHLLNEDTTIDWSNPRFPTRKIQLLPLF